MSASQFPPLRLRRAWRFLADVWRLASDRDLGLISAGVAFYAMLAVFPGAAALIALWGVVSDPEMIATQMEVLEGFVPEQAMGLLEGQVQALIDTTDTTLGWATALSTGFAILSARSGVGALIRGLKAIHGTTSESLLRDFLRAVAMTLGLLAVGLAALASGVILPVAVAVLPPGPFTGPALMAGRWAVAVLVILAGLGLVYRFGSGQGPRARGWVTPGALVALTLWAAASVAFSAYVARFADYNEVYGTLGAAVALLIWLYISAYAVLLGAAVNAVAGRAQPS